MYLRTGLQVLSHSQYSPGGARYTCYRYSIYVFGIFTCFITGYITTSCLIDTFIDGDPSIKEL